MYYKNSSGKIILLIYQFDSYISYCNTKLCKRLYQNGIIEILFTLKFYNENIRSRLKFRNYNSEDVNVKENIIPAAKPVNVEKEVEDQLNLTGPVMQEIVRK